jgi:hypothetical protein
LVRAWNVSWNWKRKAGAGFNNYLPFYYLMKVQRLIMFRWMVNQWHRIKGSLPHDNNPTPPDERRCLLAIEHIVHDYANLVSGGKEISNLHAPPLNSHIQYSFLVNCRKFGVFFSSKPPRHQGDMWFRHFVQKNIVFNLKEWTKWSDHMNTHLFHLSYGRIDNSRPWRGYEGVNTRILDDFRTAWRKFRRELPEPYKSKFAERVFLRKQPDENGRLSEFYHLDLD